MKKLVLIEDNTNFRKLVRLMFQDEAYHILDATSPKEGIKLLDENSDARVVILDLSFPNATGTTVLDHIKSRAGEYRVIVLTAYDDLLNAERASDYAIFKYLPKSDRSSTQTVRYAVEQAFGDLAREHLARQNRFLTDIQRRVNANEDLSSTLDRICGAVRDELQAYTCHIRLYDPEKGDFHLRGFSGPHEEMRNIFAQPRTRGELFSGRVLASGHAEVFDDLQNTEEFKNFIPAHGLETPEQALYWKTIRSACIVPIHTGIFKKADAVLNISSNLPAYFTTERQSAAAEFVPPMVLAITMDWLKKKREEIHVDYTGIGGMLSEMTAAFEGGKGLQGIYEVVTRRIGEIVRPEMVSIFVFDESSGLLRNEAEVRGSDEVVRSDEVYLPGESLTGWVFEHGESLRLPNPDEPWNPMEDRRYNRDKMVLYLDYTPSGKLQHYLGVPIMIGGKARGVVRALNKRSAYYGIVPGAQGNYCLLEHGFSGDCLNVLKIAASHLAIAIRNMELLAEKGHQVKRNESLVQVGQLINSALEIDEVLSRTIENMSRVMQAEICLLFLKREGAEEIVLEQCFGMPKIPEASYAIGEGATGRVALTGESILQSKAQANNGKFDKEIREFLTQKHGKDSQIESLMVVPIEAKKNILGAMKVINKVADHLQYTRDDLEFFETFARYVGVAVDNARVYKDLSRLLNGVIHEINNTSGIIPSNVNRIWEQIASFADIASFEAQVSPKLRRIKDKALQATSFANEIQAFSAGRIGVRAKVNVNELVSDTIEELCSETSASWTPVQVGQNLCGRPLICRIYTTPFRQIVRNILINAFQALEDTPSPSIAVSTSEGTVSSSGAAVIRIADNGPGIKPKDKPKIFNADFTTKPKGNGVGLWLARVHLEAVAGKIAVESEVGRGAAFTITIPLIKDDEGETNAAFYSGSDCG